MLIIKNINLLRTIRFLVPSQNASISPPIGPILGQFGINIMDFCKQFNEISRYIDSDVLVIVILYMFKNKSFNFHIKMPSVSFLVLEDNFFIVEDQIPIFVNLSTILKILYIKKYFGVLTIEDKNIFKSLCGTIRSMHLKICNDLI
jgi:large subunit ribosomal protein L11